MAFLKSIGSKIVTGLVALGVIATGISWYEMDPSTRQSLLAGAGHVLAWLGIVLVIPWATFFIIARVDQAGSNAGNNLAGGALVFTYTALEAILLAWLCHWSLPGATAWTFFAGGVLLAGVYNLLTCDWIAEKMQ